MTGLLPVGRQESVQKFDVMNFPLGFTDRTLGLRILEANRKAGTEIQMRLQSLRLLRETGHDQENPPPPIHF